MTVPEPLHLTLEEATKMLAKRYEAALHAEHFEDGHVLWKVMRWSQEESRFIILCCYFDTWEEAASDALGVHVIERDPCQELRDEVDRLKARIHEIAVAGLASSPKAVVVQAMARDLERLAGIEERR